MRVVFFVSASTDPAPRFRVYDHLKYLEQQGIEPLVNACSPGFYAVPKRFDISPAYHLLNARKIASRIPGLLAARTADAIVIQREMIPYPTPVLETLLSRMPGALIYDYDDAVYLNYSKSPAGRNKIDRTIALADLVTAGNRNLAEYARQWNPNVTVIPTAVDPSKPRVASATERGEPISESNPFVIGWTGSTSTAGYLELIAPALKQVVTRNPHTVIRVMSNSKPELSFPFEYVPWSPANEELVVPTFHCGLMPLPDDEWSKGKCALKILQYYACGVPAVVSPVGANADVVADGKSGFWATSVEEWMDRIEQLIRSSELRETFVREGSAILHAHYSTQVCAAQLVDAIHKAREIRAGRGRRHS